jgi:hypothetical protein
MVDVKNTKDEKKEGNWLGIYHLLIDLLNKPKNNNHATLKLFFKIQKTF